MAYRDNDSILYHIYQKHLFVDFYYDDLKLLIENNAHLKKYSTLQQETHKIVFYMS